MLVPKRSSLAHTRPIKSKRLVNSRNQHENYGEKGVFLSPACMQHSRGSRSPGCCHLPGPGQQSWAPACEGTRPSPRTQQSQGPPPFPASTSISTKLEGWMITGGACSKLEGWMITGGACSNCNCREGCYYGRRSTRAKCCVVMCDSHGANALLTHC